MATSLKSKLIQYLAAGDYGAVIGLAEADQRVFGKLVALAYDKEDVICWRAIEAMGACAAAVARHDASRLRNLIQRLIWSAREESGGMGWSAPELLAEIVSASPRQFADIPPIIVSLHSEDEEKVFLKGVLWAIARMAQSGITDVPGAAAVVLTALDDPDEAVRGLAVIAASRGDIEAARRLGELAGDRGRLRIYEKGRMVEKEVGKLARAALAKT
ncbi:MAG: hypothetical protein IBX61_01960 [Thermoleophilia bacterium]|nr:hypothetical protein [Thermoleophilia bacterium]